MSKWKGVSKKYFRTKQEKLPYQVLLREEFFMINTTRPFSSWNARLVPKAWGCAGRARGGLGSKCQSGHMARNLTLPVEIHKGDSVLL